MRPLRYVTLLLVLLLAVGGFVMANGGQEQGGTTAAVSTQQAVPAGKYKEAPMLAALVAQGKLPPVDQRLPQVPAVLKPEQSIGKYGGTIDVFMTAMNPWNDLMSEDGATLLRVLPDGSKVVGNILQSYDISSNGEVYTLHLRKGLKWSDGVPFTADDIVFQFKDVLWYKENLNGWNRVPQFKQIEKVDDYTVKLIADKPYYTAALLLAPAEGIGWRFFKPEHYFKKWDIVFNPDAPALAKKEGFDTWEQCLEYHMNWSPQNDFSVPTLAPWVVTSHSDTLRVMQRNPYYWKVDTAGNQLPYIDKVVSQLTDLQLYQMKIISGESDVAWTRASFSDYPMYKQNEAKAGYRIKLLNSPVPSEMVLAFNFNAPDPFKRKTYQDVRFREAMSVAINRDAINQALFFGMAKPCQATVLPNSSFYKPEWEKSYAQYDPDLANKLLDEVGLSKRDKDGFRLGPDGKPFTITLEAATDTVHPQWHSELEMIVADWQKVGVKTALRLEEGNLLSQRKNSDNHGVIVYNLNDANEPSMWSYAAESYFAYGSEYISYAYDWGQWLHAEQDIKLGRKTLADFGGKMPGVEPPDYYKQFNALIDSWANVPYGSPDYKKIGQEIFDMQAKYLFLIGTVGMVPNVLIAKNDIMNIPQTTWANFSWTGSPNMVAEQLFINK